MRRSALAWLALAAPVFARPATENYHWKSVTIKANGFIDGIVYAPDGTAYIHTDMGGAYRLDGARWTPLNDGSKWNDPAAHNLGVETFAVDPTNPDRVYMGIGTYMVASAVMRSSDRGQSWQRADVPFEMNGNGSARNTGQRLRVDPNAPEILFYGSRDDGLFRSTDSAATWHKVESFPTIGHDTGWGRDTGILFVEFDRNGVSAGTPTTTIYAGVFETDANKPRLYRSTDAGKTWQPLPGGQPTTANVFPQRCVLTPDGRTMYVTYATSTAYPGPYGVHHGAIYKITDPASEKPTWEKISPEADWAYSAITLDPIDPNTVYASELGNYNPADRILRSTDAGKTWAILHPNDHRDNASAKYAESLGIHWLGDLQINPKNRDEAMFTTGYGLYRTTNLSAAEPTWTFFNEGFEQSAVLELFSPPAGPVHLLSAIGDRDGYRHDDFDQSPAIGLHGQNNGLNRGTSDDLDVAWNDPNLCVRTVRQKPFVQWSSDNGITWRPLGDPAASAGRESTTAISGDGTRVVFSTGRAIQFSKRDGDAWSAWQPSRGDASGKVLVDLGDHTTFYAYGESGLSRSTDGGATWARVIDKLPARFNWVRAVPDHAGHLIASAGEDYVRDRVVPSEGVWRSTDGGATWTRLAKDVVTAANAVGIGAPPPGKNYPALFVQGTAGGLTGYFRSDDEGATWVRISDDAHQYGTILVIQGDPRVFGRLYVGTNGRGIVVGEPAR
jgi:photosystem II stability/assembly factor-like uncharacterized protein